MPDVQDPLLQRLVGRAHLPVMQEEVPLELWHSVAVEQPAGLRALRSNRLSLAMPQVDRSSAGQFFDFTF